MRAFLALLGMVAGLQAGPLVVHEWGTFTVLQDEQGEELGGINTDDEPVPGFVFRATGIIRPQDVGFEVRGKGVTGCHPDVRMRLETPVLYFYPAEGTAPVVDVKVGFRGGWLTEFYPQGEAVLPGRDEGYRIPAEGEGTLEWRGVKIAGREAGPATDSKVWLAPRAVDAASVTMPNGERERYLFYRGVANLGAPVRVKREGGELVLAAAEGIARAWLVDLKANGTGAFRAVGMGRTPAEFAAGDYTAENVARLRGELHAALVADGLFPKEAEAMLKTWEESYFKSPGLRLFFLVPRAWTDRVLPLNISQSAEISRVMIGRIEIVSPDQRRYLGLLSKREGRFDPADPPAAYCLLGRFANALILDEYRRRPSDGLRQLISNFQLDPGERFATATGLFPRR